MLRGLVDNRVPLLPAPAAAEDGGPPGQGRGHQVFEARSRSAVARGEEDKREESRRHCLVYRIM